MTYSFDEQIKEYRDLHDDAFEKGKVDGFEELPATPDKEFNANQVELKIKAQKIGGNLISSTRNQILEYENIIGNNEAVIRDTVVLPEFENIKTNTDQKYSAYITKEKPNFINYYTNYLSSKNNLDKFKTEKGITSENYTAPISEKAHYTILIAYGIIETIINIFIFNGGLSLPDALMLSTFISLLNIYPAVLIGNYLRNINSDDSFKKKSAYILAIFLFFFVIWLNASLGILRSYLTELASQTNNLNTFTEVFKSNAINDIFFDYAFNVFFLKAPPIKDELSIFLWLVGMFAALVACMKGYSSDEKIPELGIYIRNFKESEDIFNVSDTKMREEVSRIYSENSSNFVRIRSDLDRSIRDYKSTFLLIRKNIVEFQRKINELENEFIVLINVYRSGNKSTRNSFPPTYYEDNKPKLDLEDRFPDFANYTELIVNSKIENLEQLYASKVETLNNLQSKYNLYAQEANSYFEKDLEKFKNDARETMSRPF